MLSDELTRIFDRETGYEQAKARALARLRAPFRLGGEVATGREALHDRAGLR